MTNSSNSVAAVLADIWAARRAEYESSCRNGSAGRAAAPPDPDPVIHALAREFEDAARKELHAIREAFFHPPVGPQPVGVPTIDMPAAETPAGQQSRTPAGQQAAVETISLPLAPDATASFDADATASEVDANQTTDTFNARPVVARKPKSPLKLPTIPGYIINGILGHGGMGVVYKATHLALNREVALKMILKGEHASPAAVVRFLTEARAVAHINHPNIVQIYHIDEHDGLPSFALEFCPGGSLDRVLNKEPLAPRKAAAYAETLARAMQAAHDADVIHRDLKPSNILLTSDGTLKVTDFGLARVATDDGSGMTGSGSILGSPPYMPPEQAMGKQDEVGPLSDQYSLGATLYEFLTGRPPFQGPTAMDTVRQVLDREPVPPSALQPGVPKDLETICLKALAKEPAKRYASTAAMADDLKAFQEGRTIAARPVSRPEKAWRWAKRNPRVAGLLGAVTALLIVLGVGGSVFAGVYREKALEADVNFHEAENRRAEVAAALDASRRSLKESNESFEFARDISVSLAQQIPAELRRRMIDTTTQLNVLDLITKATLDRKSTGDVRNLPDRMLHAAMSLRGDAYASQNNFGNSLLAYETSEDAAKRMQDSEPVEKDKADGHRAAAMLKIANLRYVAAMNGVKSTTFKAEPEKCLPLCLEAVAIHRLRVSSPRSFENHEDDRRHNLAMALSEMAKYQSSEAAEASLTEAVALQSQIVRNQATEIARTLGHYHLGLLQEQLSKVHRDQDKHDAERDMLVSAIRELKQYVAGKPDDLSARSRLAKYNRDLGDFIFLDGDRIGPMPYYRTAYDLTLPFIKTGYMARRLHESASDSYRAGLSAIEAKDPTNAQKRFLDSFRYAEIAFNIGLRANELVNLIPLAAARSGEFRHAEKWCAVVAGTVAPTNDQSIEAASAYATLAGCIATTPDLAHLTPDQRAEKKAAIVVKAVTMLEKREDQLKAYLEVHPEKRAVRYETFHRKLNTEPDLDGIREEPSFKVFVAKIALAMKK